MAANRQTSMMTDSVSFLSESLQIIAAAQQDLSETCNSRLNRIEAQLRAESSFQTHTGGSRAESPGDETADIQARLQALEAQIRLNRVEAQLKTKSSFQTHETRSRDESPGEEAADIQARLQALEAQIPRYDSKITLLELRVTALDSKLSPQSSRTLGLYADDVDTSELPLLTPKLAETSKPYSEAAIEGAVLPPESMYNYCMQRASVSSDLFNDWALVYWILLFFMQFAMMAAFCVINDLEASGIGVTPKAQRSRTLSACMFSTHLCHFCVGFFAVVLVACSLRSDDTQTLAAALPQHEDVPLLWWFGQFAWLWQTIFLPGCFALEAASMFARSDDAMDVVMNTLAVTFIMDIDTIMYQTLLSEEEKRAYQQDTDRYGKALPCSARCSSAIFKLNLVLMTLTFTSILTILQFDVHGTSFMICYWTYIPALYFIVFCGRTLLQSYFVGPIAREGLAMYEGPIAQEGLGKHCLSKIPNVLGTAVLSVVCYTVSCVFASTRLILPPLIYFGPADFDACLAK